MGKGGRGEGWEVPKPIPSAALSGPATFLLAEMGGRVGVPGAAERCEAEPEGLGVLLGWAASPGCLY